MIEVRAQMLVLVYIAVLLATWTASPEQASAGVNADPVQTVTRVFAPGLSQHFSFKIADYVVSESAPNEGCTISIALNTPSDQPASIGLRTPKTGVQGIRQTISDGQRLSFTLTQGVANRTYSIRCLPYDFPAVKATGQGTAQWYLSGDTFRLTIPSYAYAFDQNGTPVWWKRDDMGRPSNINFLTHSQLATLGIDAPYAFTWLHELQPRIFTLDGAETDFPVFSDRHDWVVTSHNSVLAIQKVTRPCRTAPATCVDMRAYGGSSHATIEDRDIVERDGQGNEIWRWSSASHIAIAESARWLRNPFFDKARTSNVWDVVHVNAIQDLGDSVIISARYPDAIYKIDKATGAILWKLGGTPTPQSLTIRGDGRVWSLDGQHDVHLLPDGTISVYDNGALTRRPPRILRFRVDEGKGTATLVQVITDNRIVKSTALGSARLLSNGHWVVFWGQAYVMSELSASNRPVFTLNFPSDQSGCYRVIPVEAGALPAEALRAGMDAMYGVPT